MGLGTARATDVVHALDGLEGEADPLYFCSFARPDEFDTVVVALRFGHKADYTTVGRAC